MNYKFDKLYKWNRPISSYNNKNNTQMQFVDYTTVHILLVASVRSHFKDKQPDEGKGMEAKQ